jgi:hypothetical protein
MIIGFVNFFLEFFEAPLAPITAISGWPSKIHGTNVFRVHHIIGTTIGFTVITVTLGTVASLKA